MYIIVFVIISIILIKRITRAYRKNWSSHLGVTMDFEKNTMVEGDNGTLVQTVSNKKFLPLWWADLKFYVPKYLRFDSNVMMDHDYYKKVVISALSYELVKKSLPFTAARRGYYTVKSAELLSSDLFVQYMFIKEYSFFTELYVFPETKSLHKFEVDFRKIIGEILTKRHLIEDPFEFRNIRDYSSFDSLKTVNWNASAKTGEIKVNHFNYTSSQSVMILLDLDSYNAFDKKEIREDLIRIAAYFTHELIHAGIPVGLVTNGCDCITEDEIFAPCKNGSNQEAGIFKRFARIAADRVTRSFTQVIDDRLTSQDHSHYILISCHAGEALQAKVHEVTAGGHSLQWLLLKDREWAINIRKPKNMTICEGDY